MIIDVHAHVLPGVDDGARNIKESLRMLQKAYRQGIRAVVATPHYSRRSDPPDYSALLEQLQEQSRKKCPDLTLYLGQETYYHEELPRRLQGGKAFTMAGSHYVLVEFDIGISYEGLFRGIRSLQAAGYFPVLAHMERYECLRREENLSELCASGCVMQMNYASLEGSCLRPEVHWCRSQVKKGRIQLLGTDMHGVQYRSPDIEGAMGWLDRHVDKQLQMAMTYENPLHMIKDEGMKWDR